jgi:hypothetical protein
VLLLMKVLLLLVAVGIAAADGERTCAVEPTEKMNYFMLSDPPSFFLQFNVLTLLSCVTCSVVTCSIESFISRRNLSSFVFPFSSVFCIFSRSGYASLNRDYSRIATYTGTQPDFFVFLELE